METPTTSVKDLKAYEVKKLLSDWRNVTMHLNQSKTFNSMILEIHNLLNRSSNDHERSRILRASQYKLNELSYNM